MQTTTCYALEPLNVFDPVKIEIDKKIEGAISCKRCRKGKPHGLSIQQVEDHDPERYSENPTVGQRISVLQQGIIPHRDDWNYHLEDRIYCKDGQLTTDLSPHPVGKVVPQGIWIDFLS